MSRIVELYTRKAVASLSTYFWAVGETIGAICCITLHLYVTALVSLVYAGVDII
jgi:hypothetical protein